jgi:hypothetical protein
MYDIPENDNDVLAISGRISREALPDEKRICYVGSAPDFHCPAPGSTEAGRGLSQPIPGNRSADQSGGHRI